MADKFSYSYNGLKYADAQKQIAQQLDPLFNRAIDSVNKQKYQSDVQAGQVAAARGLGHSGLAADQLNKIAIAAQGQIGDISAQRASQLAQMAQDLMERDKDRGMQARSQAWSEWMGQQNLKRDDRNYNYQVGRDKIGDARYNKEWNYQLGRDKIADSRYNKEWNYQVGRDKVSDQRYNKEWTYQVGRDKINDAWRQKEWSQMSPAEKQRMAMDFEYAKKKATFSGGGGGRGRGRGSSYGGGGSSAEGVVKAALDRIQTDSYRKMTSNSPKLDPKAKSGLASQPGSYWYARGYGNQYLPKNVHSSAKNKKGLM